MIIGSKLLIAIVIAYYIYKEEVVNNYYKFELNNEVVDSIFYDKSNHNYPTFVIQGDRRKTFYIKFAYYLKDMGIKIKKGDTLYKRVNDYTLYRINRNDIDTFRYIGKLR